jgi:hypothetical protein
MGLSQVKGCCYFWKTHLEPQQHRLFYSCLLTFPVIQDIQLFQFPYHINLPILFML